MKSPEAKPTLAATEVDLLNAIVEHRLPARAEDETKAAIRPFFDALRARYRGERVRAQAAARAYVTAQAAVADWVAHAPADDRAAPKKRTAETWHAVLSTSLDRFMECLTPNAESPAVTTPAPAAPARTPPVATSNDEAPPQAPQPAGDDQMNPGEAPPEAREVLAAGNEDAPVGELAREVASCEEDLVLSPTRNVSLVGAHAAVEPGPHLDPEPAATTVDLPIAQAPSKAEAATGSVLERPWPPLSRSTAAPPFPTAALAHWHEDFVLSVAACTQTAVDLGALHSLGALSGAVAQTAFVQVARADTHALQLWTMVAAPSGEGKGPVDRIVRAPFEAMEAEWRKEAGVNQPRIASARSVMAKRRTRLEASAAREDDPDERTRLMEQAAALAVDLAAMDGRVEPSILVEDATPPALVALLADHGRLLMLSDEGDTSSMRFAAIASTRARWISS